MYYYCQVGSVAVTPTSDPKANSNSGCGGEPIFVFFTIPIVNKSGFSTRYSKSM